MAGAGSYRCEPRRFLLPTDRVPEQPGIVVRVGLVPDPSRLVRVLRAMHSGGHAGREAMIGRGLPEAARTFGDDRGVALRIGRDCRLRRDGLIELAGNGNSVAGMLGASSGKVGLWSRGAERIRGCAIAAQAGTRNIIQ